jgi:polyisoprenoid-binding protein YceI
MSDHHAIRLSPANTRVTFAVRWLGVLTVRGRFTEVEGTLSIPDGCVESAEIAIDVLAGSLRTGIALRDRHLRGSRFLDAARFPRIAFRSIRVERPNGILVVTGRLTLRGLERTVYATVPLDYADGAGMQSLVRMCTHIHVPRIPHRIGIATGLRRLSPLLLAIGPTVDVRAEVLVPATQLLPALLPALGR